jgi:predicted ATPase/transcriptional regulator with XRE-family HTH domain
MTDPTTSTAAGTFGELLRQRRTAAGLTQEELAERAGLSVRGLGYLEKDARRPYRDTVRRLADALHLDEPERTAFEAAAQSASPILGEAGATDFQALPSPPTPLIGRAEEVATAMRMLDHVDVRLLTLTGPGGVGKTRLALQVASDLRSTLRDGVVWVDLAPLTDPQFLMPTIAQALGVHEAAGQNMSLHLQAALGGRQILLVLDNFEHLLAAAPHLADLVAACPRLRVLVTSRAALRVRAEYVLPVPPLAVPDLERLPSVESLTQVPAVGLFVQRARAVAPAFALTPATARAVAEICLRLDGLPLALELAAARVRVLPPMALLRRLESRLALASRGARDVPLRQQTLRATIEWSYNLLEPVEQVMLARLAVYVGGCTLEAAEAICADAGNPTLLEEIEALVEQSLLQYESAGSEPRYSLLETISEFARERLDMGDERERLCQRHADYYLALAQQSTSMLKGAEQGEWMKRLDREYGNIQVALQWAHVQGQASAGLRVTGALFTFWAARGQLSEAEKWLEAFLGQASNDATPERAKALDVLGIVMAWRGNNVRALALFEQSLGLYRRAMLATGVADALYHLGNIAITHGTFQRAIEHYEESMAIRRGMQNDDAVAGILCNLGNVARYQGKLDLATAHYEESLRRELASGDTSDQALLLNNLGIVARFQGYFERAISLHEQCLDMFHELGDKAGIAFTQIQLAAVALDQDDHDRAEAWCIAALTECRELRGDRTPWPADARHLEIGSHLPHATTLAQELGEEYGIAILLHMLGVIILKRGHVQHALALYRDALALFRQQGYLWGIALFLRALGDVAKEFYDTAHAAESYTESLALSHKAGCLVDVAQCLEGLAGAIAAADRAVRLAAVAAAIRRAIGAPVSPREKVAVERLLDINRVSLGAERFDAIWSEAQAQPWQQVVQTCLPDDKLV